MQYTTTKLQILKLQILQNTFDFFYNRDSTVPNNKSFKKGRNKMIQDSSLTHVWGRTTENGYALFIKMITSHTRA